MGCWIDDEDVRDGGRADDVAVRGGCCRDMDEVWSEGGREKEGWRVSEGGREREPVRDADGECNDGARENDAVCCKSEEGVRENREPMEEGECRGDSDAISVLLLPKLGVRVRDKVVRGERARGDTILPRRSASSAMSSASVDKLFSVSCGRSL